MSVITATDRLSFTLVLAVLVHALIVLGVAVVLPPSEPAAPPSPLAVTWVTVPSASVPTRAALLGAQSQAGAVDQTPMTEPTPPPAPTAVPHSGGHTAAATLEPPPAPPVPTLPPAARADAWADYLWAFQTRVQAQVSSAQLADFQARGLSGEVRLAVTLAANGRVRAMEVLQSSGWSELDAAAVASVQQAQPFPAFPLALPSGRTELTLVRRWRFESR